MAKKLLDPKAKAKKQKKIAIAGAVLLVALLAYQGPKTMKMLNPGPPPQSTPAPATPAPVTPGVTPPPVTGAPAGGAPATGLPPSGSDGLVVNADLSPVPLDGQLAALTQFTSKDPFKQQVIATISTPSGSTSTPTTTTPAAPGSPGGSFTPGPGTTTTPGSTPAPAPTIATISVNGVEMAVSVKMDFPADSPFFRLVSLTATTAKIGIAGGSLATGSPTVTLKKGKALTLMNTADGTRYILVLISMGDTTTPGASSGGTTTTPTPTTGTSTTSTTTTTTAGH
jgi:hypothetical protein